MKGILDFFIQFYAFFSVLPFIAFFLVWAIVRFSIGDKRKATHLSIDVTTLMLIGSVSVMYNYLFQSANGFWWILLYFLIATGFLGGLQNRIKGRIDGKRLFKIVWRCSFLLLGAVYVLFFVAGLVKTLRFI